MNKISGTLDKAAKVFSKLRRALRYDDAAAQMLEHHTLPNLGKALKKRPPNKLEIAMRNRMVQTLDNMAYK